ncbi:putative lipid II flippase FtsW [Patescibacteria group bacterium]|nr:putative lipid II flippase FtsW [Patescibacteria group bacterium]MBU1663059.1 putative lipid II flippase FtsW [Patescibacteria group bacterium]MBU1934235.1 putative lipid II flippase FtsW [Patescibacteria group bacterium]MBU2007926.1 putative lipid II flippase FtsW [Patescibacteria group bacterium]MBU2233269.1 putative lipid II flippase FtsW [Patescibacteria group bacterium]
MSSLIGWFNELINYKGEHESDRPLIFIVGAIIVFGLIMLSSASSVIAYSAHQDSYYFFKHQLFGLFLGLAAAWFFSRVDYQVWRKYALWMLIASIGLLLLVFIPGLAGAWGTSRSWINVFGFSLQPSEFVKITFLLYLAAWLEGRKKQLAEASRHIRSFVVVLGVIALLMILQPDMGTLTIIALTSLVVYFIGGGNLKHIIGLMLLGLVTLIIMVNIYPYQANRFKCMIDPSYSPKEYCYQVNQSLIAVGSGGFWGRGLGASRQKFLYLPQAQNDAIFPIISEETGCIFSIGLILLYLMLFYRGFLIAKRAPDDFGKILAIGIVSWIVIQTLINIGGMVNIMPLTGVPLPMVSYGGSAMLVALASIGILINISKQTRGN